MEEKHETQKHKKNSSNKPMILISIVFFLILLSLIIIESNLSTVPRISFQKINLTNNGFTPNNLTVNLGSSVSFYNKEQRDSDVVVTKGPIWFDSGEISPNSNFKWTFTYIGNYSIEEVRTGASLNLSVLPD